MGDLVAQPFKRRWIFTIKDSRITLNEIIKNFWAFKGLREFDVKKPVIS